MTNIKKHLNKQKGVALVYCLIILLILTIIAVAVSSNLTTSTKLLSNQRDKQIAFEVAEIALRVGEQWVNELEGAPLPEATQAAHDTEIKLWEIDSGDTPSWWFNNKASNSNDKWWEDNLIAVEDIKDYNIEQFPLKDSPRYAIEYIGPKDISQSANADNKDKVVRHFFRVTARGVGPGGSKVFLQTTISKDI